MMNKVAVWIAILGLFALTLSNLLTIYQIAGILEAGRDNAQVLERVKRTAGDATSDARTALRLSQELKTEVRDLEIRVGSVLAELKRDMDSAKAVGQ